MRLSLRLHGGIHLVAGGLLVLSSLLIGWIPEFALYYQPLQKPLLLCGLVLPLLAGFHRRIRFARLSAGVCLLAISFVLTVALAEVAFRLVAFDFRRQESTWRRIPPFYRKPMVPTGTAFFRRAGPEEWTGPVITTYLKELRLPTAPYRDEAVITVKYDDQGFRNDPRPAEWLIAVAGDSFTELGHLPSAQLFTTILGQRLAVPVRNLGVSYTGPLSQLSYLNDYGISSMTRVAVIVFYEGNDLEDLTREHAAELQYRQTGRRVPFRFRKQTSLLRALGERVRTGVARSPPSDPPVIAYFQSRRGRLPMTLGPAPKAGADLTAETRQALQDFFQRYAAFGKAHGLRVGLAYLPCKIRVLHHRIEFTDAAVDTDREWTPTDLPAVIANGCRSYGIEFRDLTPCLVAETSRSGEAPYSGLYDLHLNARGAAAVAEELTRWLRDLVELSRSRQPQPDL